ncbi:hypothetical protein C0416_04640 [bacterium]|nr:hypothetical protein [bacterium]
MDFNLYFAWAAWITLLIIVLSRPLADLLQVKFIRKIQLKRKWIGLICGAMVVLHVVVYSITFSVSLKFFFDSSYWDFAKFTGWGGLAFVTMIPLLLTSNNYAIRLLKRNWKRLQRLTYLFFIASGIHIYMVGGKWPLTLVPMAIWLTLWVWAYFLNLSKRNKVKQ